MEPLEYRIQECEALIAHSGFPPCFYKGGGGEGSVRDA